MRTALLVLLAAAGIAVLAWASAKEPYPSLFVRHVPDARVLNERGRWVSFRSESSRALVIFGYTRCRDACPLVLAEAGRVTRAIPPGRRPRIVFVTVDPGFDRPDVLARFLAHRSGSPEGITGDRLVIERIYAAFTGAAGLPTAAGDHDVRIFAVDALGEISDAPDRGTALAAIARALANE